MPKDSFNGLTEVVPSILALAKSGDSAIFFRIQIDMPTNGTEIKKGMRQPHDSQLGAVIKLFVIAMALIEIAIAKGAVI